MAIFVFLLAIKNVGYAGYKAIEAERQNGTFKDIFDFVLEWNQAN